MCVLDTIASSHEETKATLVKVVNNKITWLFLYRGCRIFWTREVYMQDNHFLVVPCPILQCQNQIGTNNGIQIWKIGQIVWGVEEEFY